METRETQSTQETQETQETQATQETQETQATPTEEKKNDIQSSTNNFILCDCNACCSSCNIM